MDLSPGRARLAQAEDYEPGRNRYQPPERGERRIGTPAGQRKVLKCFNCDKPGHFKRDCRQPLRQNPFYRQNQSSSRTRQADTKEDDQYAARSIVVMTLRGQMVRDVRQWVPVVQGVKVSGSLGVR
jgi:hypothetical protein